MRGQSGGAFRALRPGADHDRHAGFREALAPPSSAARPRAAASRPWNRNRRRPTCRDPRARGLAGRGRRSRGAVGAAGCHEGGDQAPEDGRGHRLPPPARDRGRRPRQICRLYKIWPQALGACLHCVPLLLVATCGAPKAEPAGHGLASCNDDVSAARNERCGDQEPVTRHLCLDGEGRVSSKTTRKRCCRSTSGRMTGIPAAGSPSRSRCARCGRDGSSARPKPARRRPRRGCRGASIGTKASTNMSPR